MRRLSQFSLSFVAVAAVAGCSSVPVVTQITSDPAGARIEVNNGYVGTTPVDVTLPQTPYHHRLKNMTIVVAQPIVPGQKPQQKVLLHRQEAPGQMWFNMNIDQLAATNAPANPSDSHEQPVQTTPAPSP